METQVQLAAEQRARVLIDRQLRMAGWAVVDRHDLNLFTPRGSAVREAWLGSSTSSHRSISSRT